MMAGNPNYWSMNDMHPQSHQLSNSQFVYGSNNNINININDNSSSVITSDSTAATTDHHQDFPVRSWSQLLLGGLASGEEERYGESLFQQKKMNIWEEDEDHHVLNLNNSISNFGRINHHHGGGVHDVKQEVAQSATSCQLYDNHNNNNDDHDDNNYDHHQANRSNWAHHNNIAAAAAMPVSSPTSCVTSLSNNFLNFSGGPATTTTTRAKINQELSSECNSTSSGGVSKKARVQQSSAQPALKVRKEKLGDRITSLHQLVSPFGKTDTASVLSEAIGYIRFLQGQIEALSTPYMRNAPANSVQERNCLYPEEAAATGQDSVKNLRSRGLCLVPISCTEKVGNDNGADYWAPAALGGGGF